MLRVIMYDIACKRTLLYLKEDKQNSRCLESQKSGKKSAKASKYEENKILKNPRKKNKDKKQTI